ncbi:MAG TPA: class I SAM-dependent methyltransferase [Egibacteraceae bacterium]|nr:class I SAM-dependent methyltransferase [Egibacteraceae bacterium]
MDAKQANVAYHDWEAANYDRKWSISFDQRCIDYAYGRFRKAVPEHRGERYRRVLEVGTGTGFFLLNLWQAGVVGEAHAVDISSGMVRVCVGNGERLGLTVHGRVGDAEALPYPDHRFDLVCGHAVLHHLPDLKAAFAEFRRVLRPGGRLVVAGEPTLLGDAVAGQVKRLARVGVKLAAVLAGSERLLRPDGHEPSPGDEAAALETLVDQHTFQPARLRRLAGEAGFCQVRTVTEELTASWFGWANRTVQALVRPGLLPPRWPWYAYRTWRALFALDDRVAARIVPGGVFYNCILSATAPRADDRAAVGGRQPR